MKKTLHLIAIMMLPLLAVMIGAYAYSPNVDIDYSHNVVGTGTVMTDYRMGSTDSTEAAGRVRGTGEVVNKYVFQLNNSENVTIEDQFQFTKISAPHEITIRDYPKITKNPGSFRLLGTSWAAKVKLLESANNQSNSS
ncbi:Uncharacterised protein [uncultured archaeon]|nr:Uncharacterised protein [uncultured archaeon]